MTEPALATTTLVRTRTLGTFRIHALEAGLVRLDGGAMFGVVPKPLWERRIPADERQRPKQVFSRIQAWLYRVLPPQQRGLPAVAADPRVALDAAYTAAHRRRFPPPAARSSLTPAQPANTLAAAPSAPKPPFHRSASRPTAHSSSPSSSFPVSSAGQKTCTC